MLEALLDLLAELLGLSGGEEERPPRRRAAPQPPLSQNREQPPLRQQQARRQPAARRAAVREMPAEPAPPAGTVSVSQTMRDIVAEPLAPSASSGGGQVPGFVAALRADPDAAKHALVYAEIFGPPLADRNPFGE